MNILFLSRWFPYPPINGSKLRIYNLLRGLAQDHSITLISFADQPNINPNAPELEEICQDVKIVPWKPFDPASRQAGLGLFSSTPRFVVDTFSNEMKQYIQDAISTGNYDLVIASQFDMAVYSEYFKCLPAVFEEIEVGVIYGRYQQAETLWRRLRNGLTWTKHRRYLANQLKNFQAGTVVSQQERTIVSNKIKNGHRLEVIPNCVDLKSYEEIKEIPQPNTLIFTGAFTYNPNYEAMAWFVDEVYPFVQAQNPQISLTITGNHNNRPLPTSKNITLTGFVDDVRPLIARSWISIVPLHVGGGTRLKILEAMALKTPVIATSKGAEGLDAEPGKHLLIADSPKAFADSIIKLHQDTQLRQYLTSNAYRLIQENYDWTTTIPKFLKLIEQVTFTN
ncbi:MAG: glycosyltransferase [Anaerolineae bacterium]|nr:glycosyltransferase [Anaerolineae bacterium]MCB9107512.1 glycosyltransferase [Anaerolineales bacterium]